MEKERIITGNRVQVFCPEAEVLSQEEISRIPARNREHPGVKGRKGVWLSVFCPDASCLTEGDRLSVPIIVAEGGEAKGVPPKERGYWLRLFCPEDQCEIQEPTDAPS
jgi:hypothetical protein